MKLQRYFEFSSTKPSSPTRDRISSAGLHSELPMATLSSSDSGDSSYNTSSLCEVSSPSMTLSSTYNSDHLVQPAYSSKSEFNREPTINRSHTNSLSEVNDPSMTLSSIYVSDNLDQSWSRTHGQSSKSELDQTSTVDGSQTSSLCEINVPSMTLSSIYVSDNRGQPAQPVSLACHHLSKSEFNRASTISRSMSTPMLATGTFRLSYNVKYSKAIDLLMRLPDLKKEFECELKNLAAIVDWPQHSQQFLEIRHIADDQRKQPQDWKTTCIYCIKRYLSKISFGSANIPRCNWMAFKTRVDKEIKSTELKMALMTFDDSMCVVNIEGHVDKVEHLKIALTAISDDIERIKTCTTQTIPNVNLHQMMLLQDSNCLTEVMNAYPKVDFKVTHNDICLTGPREIVSDASLTISKMLTGMVNKSVSSKGALGSLLQQETVKNDLLTCFKEKGIKATWLQFGNEIHVFAFNVNDLDNAIELIKDKTSEEEILLDEALLKSQRWSAFLGNLKKECETVEFQQNTSSKRIVFASMEYWKDHIKQAVKKYASEQTSVDENFPVDDAKIELITRVKSHDVENIKQYLEESGGSLCSIPAGNLSGFSIHGPKAAVDSATAQLKSLTAVEYRCLQRDCPLQKRFLRSPEGHRELTRLQQTLGISVRVTDKSGPTTNAAQLAREKIPVGNNKFVSIVMTEDIDCGQMVSICNASSSTVDSHGEHIFIACFMVCTCILFYGEHIYQCLLLYVELMFVAL